MARGSAKVKDHRLAPVLTNAAAEAWHHHRATIEVPQR